MHVEVSAARGDPAGRDWRARRSNGGKLGVSSEARHMPFLAREDGQ
jgi:hypothetical protein